MTKNFFWIDLNKTWLPQLNVGLLPVNKTVKHTEYAALYEKEDEHSFLDMLNLLYVGTTRAEDALYILSSELQNEPAEANSVTALLLEYLKSIGQWEGFITYTFGESGFQKEGGKVIGPNGKLYVKGKTRSGGMLISGIKVKTKARQLWSEETVASIDKGLLLHEALKQIRYAGDEAEVVRKLVAQGVIAVEQQEKILRSLQNVIQHADLADYFKPEWQVLNERPILKCGEKTRVPDRVVLKGNSAVVIEYKTGAVCSDASRQINSYAIMLQEAGVEVQKKIIFYTGLLKAEVVPWALF